VRFDFNNFICIKELRGKEFTLNVKASRHLDIIMLQVLYRPTRQSLLVLADIYNVISNVMVCATL